MRQYNIIVNMEKNNRFLIITSIIVGAILIIALALIFTRGGDDTTPTTNRDNTTENKETSDQTPTPNPESQPPYESEEVQLPDPLLATLPDSWDQLTDAQKIAINPFDCSEAQTISEATGRCFDDPTDCFAEDSFAGLPWMDIEQKTQEELEAGYDPEFIYDRDGKKLPRLDLDLKQRISDLGLTDRGATILEDIDELIWFNKDEYPEPDCWGALPAGEHFI